MSPTLQESRSAELWVTYGAGELVRCPGKRWSGVVETRDNCAKGLEEVGPLTLVRVRVQGAGLVPPLGPTTLRPCPGCGTMLELWHALREEVA